MILYNKMVQYNEKNHSNLELFEAHVGIFPCV